MKKQTIPFPDEVYALYPYGSRVYGTFRSDSDWDFILILNGEIQQQQINLGKNSYNVMNKQTFQDALNNHEAWALECFFLSPTEILVAPTEQWNFTFNKSKMVNYFLFKMEKEWNKAAQKFQIQNILAAKKSLFHALRIGMFGFQLLKNEKIVNYSEANPFWKMIFNNPNKDWLSYRDVFQPILTSMIIHLKQMDARVNSNSFFPKTTDLNLRRDYYADSKSK